MRDQSAVCAQCEQEVPASELSSRRANKCRTCRNAYHREWRRRNAEAHRATVKRYRTSAKGAATTHARLLRAKYGLRPDDFERMLSEQGSACAICREAFADNAPPCIDHCHDTGRVRGLLCRACNAALGGFGDDSAIVTAALAYLTRTP